MGIGTCKLILSTLKIMMYCNVQFTRGEGSDIDLAGKLCADVFLPPTGHFGRANLNSLSSEEQTFSVGSVSLSFSVSKFNSIFSLFAVKGSSPVFT